MLFMFRGRFRALAFDPPHTQTVFGSVFGVRLPQSDRVVELGCGSLKVSEHRTGPASASSHRMERSDLLLVDSCFSVHT